MKKFLAFRCTLFCIAVFSFSLPVFAVETSMTQEAKQQVLDALAVYEQQQITQLSAQNTQSDQTVQEGIFCPDKSCVDVQRPAQSDEAFDEGKPVAHRVKLYFLNDAPFQEGYQHRSESFFHLKGEELDLFKDTILYHYLGHNSEKFKAKLIVTKPKYVGIKVYITQEDLKVLTDIDTRITKIRHKGNSGLVMMAR